MALPLRDRQISAIIALAFYEVSVSAWLFFYPQVSHDERVMFLAGTVMFGVLVAFAVYRIFYLGLTWVEYDIPAERGIGFVGRKYRQRKIPLNRLLRGYKDFEKTLELTGGLRRIGVKTQEECFRY